MKLGTPLDWIHFATTTPNTECCFQADCALDHFDVEFEFKLDYYGVLKLKSIRNDEKVDEEGVEFSRFLCNQSLVKPFGRLLSVVLVNTERYSALCVVEQASLSDRFLL